MHEVRGFCANWIIYSGLRIHNHVFQQRKATCNMHYNNFPNEKGKGKGHPVRGHEGTEGE